MLRSRSNTLLAVRRVTEVNAGRLTAGVDGRVILDGQDKADLAVQIQRRQRPWQARPVKRVYIPKADGRRRPLGIPVIVDRVLQARVAAGEARDEVLETGADGVNAARRLSNETVDRARSATGKFSSGIAERVLRRRGDDEERDEEG